MEKARLLWPFELEAAVGRILKSKTSSNSDPKILTETT